MTIVLRNERVPNEGIFAGSDIVLNKFFKNTTDTCISMLYVIMLKQKYNGSVFN